MTILNQMSNISTDKLEFSLWNYEEESKSGSSGILQVTTNYKDDSGSSKTISGAVCRVKSDLQWIGGSSSSVRAEVDTGKYICQQLGFDEKLQFGNIGIYQDGIGTIESNVSPAFRNLQCWGPCIYSNHTGNCEVGDYIFLSCTCAQDGHVTGRGCVRCSPGSVFDNKTEECICRDGAYKTEDGECACEAGYVRNKESYCVTCPENYFSTSEDVECKPCPPDQISPAGSNVCYKCTDGQTQVSEGCLRCDEPENCSTKSRSGVIVAVVVSLLIVVVLVAVVAVFYYKTVRLGRIARRYVTRKNERKKEAHSLDTRVEIEKKVAWLRDRDARINENRLAVAKTCQDEAGPSWVY